MNAPLAHARTYEIVKATWLTKKPHPDAKTVTIVSTAVLALGSLIYLRDLFGLAHLMSASREQVFAHGEWWRLWTTTLAHADIGHLVSNSFLFFTLGYFLNGYFGLRLFPIAAFVWGGIINIFALLTYDPETTLIGASGVVYWLGGTWLVLYFYLSRQKNDLQRWLRTLGVGILVFMPAETFEPRVSYRTHFIGFAFGLIAGFWHYYRHREKFLAEEVRETIVEETDPLDDLPPPEGFR